MINRSKHLPFYTFFIGLLIISFGLNILFYNRILILHDTIKGFTPWVTSGQLDEIRAEINRLEKTKYFH